MSGKRDSNPRPSAWEADALPTELLPLIDLQKIHLYTLNEHNLSFYFFMTPTTLLKERGVKKVKPKLFLFEV